ncbi:tetratricopeptide repeat protein [Streptomyces sp. NPDC097619]|uniref:tetratricopeptide repeat protein n=1 Tax=Streptomyces sp. NPDC097619 TaxID=3157228 RepID=UPI0033205537
MLQHLIAQDEHLRMVPTDRDQLTAAVAGMREDLRAPTAGNDPERTRMLARWVGIGLVTLGDPGDALAFLRQALDLATAGGNTRAAIATELNLGDAYRYAGHPQTADSLYHRALDAARDQHPELLDFALQHLGKHLMEQGDLTAARTHLLEARRLRTAKGEAGLIESTQAALDHVELLIKQTGPDSFTATDVEDETAQRAEQWTAWLQAHTTTRTRQGRNEAFPALRDPVSRLTAHQLLRPVTLQGGSFPAELIEAMAVEAERVLAGGGYLHNGKRNAAVGDAANRFAGQVDLAAVVKRSTGLEVEQPHGGVYIGYTAAGQFLDFHVDESGFGEVNLILCLTHRRPATAATVSTTVFLGPDGYTEYDLTPGEGLLFDGAATPHGRTPLAAGEQVTLVSLGFRERDRTARPAARVPPGPDQPRSDLSGRLVRRIRDQSDVSD